MPSKLDPDAFERFLETHDGWTWKGTFLEKEWEFADFAQAVAFVNDVAAVAESVGHHPDIEIHYNKVALRLSTHAEGAVTGLDLDLAARIDAAR